MVNREQPDSESRGERKRTVVTAVLLGLLFSFAAVFLNRIIPMDSHILLRFQLAFGWMTGVWIFAWRLRHELLDGWKWLTERRDSKPWWPVAVVLLIWVVAGVSTMKYTSLIRQDEPTGDEPEYIMLCRSLLDEGDFELEVDQATGVCNEFMSGRFGLRGRSVRPFGLPVLLSPAYLWGRHMPWPGLPHSLYLWIGLFYVWLGVEFFRLIQAATNRPRLAWFGTLAAMLLPPLAPYAFQVYPEIPAAVLILRLFRREFYGDNDRERFTDGLCLACIPMFHQKYMFLFVMSGLHLLSGVFFHRRKQILDWLALIVPGALSLIALSVFFGQRFDIWLPTAPYSVQGSLLKNLFTLHTLKVIGAQFLDRKWGLIMVCPLLVFTFSGIIALWRRRPWVWLWWFTTCGGFIVLLSAYPLWWGGFSPPCRFLLPVVPLLWFGAVQFWARPESRRDMIIILVLLLGVLSVYFSYLMIFGSPYDYQICSPYLYPEESPNGSALWAAVSPSLDWNEIFPAVERNGRWNHILPDSLRFNLTDGLIMIVMVMFLIVWTFESPRRFSEISRDQMKSRKRSLKARVNDYAFLGFVITFGLHISLQHYSDNQMYYRYRHQLELRETDPESLQAPLKLPGVYGVRTGEWIKAPEPRHGIYYPPVYIQDMPDTLWPGGYEYSFQIPVWWNSEADSGVVVFSVENRITRQKSEARLDRVTRVDRGNLEVTLMIPKDQEALFKLVMYGDHTCAYSYQLPQLRVRKL